MNIGIQTTFILVYIESEIKHSVHTDLRPVGNINCIFFRFFLPSVRKVNKLIDASKLLFSFFSLLLFTHFPFHVSDLIKQSEMGSYVKSFILCENINITDAVSRKSFFKSNEHKSANRCILCQPSC